jgi:uncharacterized protein YcbX
MNAPMAAVTALYRYPVKGLSAEALDRVALAAGETMPLDRAYAIANGPSPFDPAAPITIRKMFFLMLMRNERLAELRTVFDPSDHRLAIRKDGTVVAEGRLDTAEGRRAIEAWFDAAFAAELRGPARVLSAPGHSFSDTAGKVVSLINLATLRELEGVVGASVDPLRFRGNLYVDGLEPWAEFGWVGKRIAAGGVILEGTARIDRCAATNVDPLSGRRDLRVPDALEAAYGHHDCGIYLRVITGGMLAVGDPIGSVAGEPAA